MKEYTDYLCNLKLERFQCLKSIISKNSTTHLIRLGNYRYKIQLITMKYYDSIQEIFDNFDITVCKFATDGQTILAPYESIKDCDTNRLTYIKKDMNLNRFYKYLRYGFVPNLSSSIQALRCTSTQHINIDAWTNTEVDYQ